MPPCDIFLGIRGTFWDSGEIFCWILQKFPGIYGFLVDDRENS